MKYKNNQPPKPPKGTKSLVSNFAEQERKRKQRNIDALRNSPKPLLGYKQPRKKSSKVLTIKKPKAR
jgi:hypothetical protein